MADEQIGQIVPLLQVAQQVDDLGLNFEEAVSISYPEGAKDEVVTMVKELMEELTLRKRDGR